MTSRDAVRSCAGSTASLFPEAPIRTLSTTFWAIVTLGLLAAPTAAGSQGAGEEAPPQRFVDVIEVSGLLDRVLADFVADAIGRAEADGAEALVIQLDSGSSVLDGDRLDDLVDRLERAAVPVAVWIGPAGSVAAGGAERLVAAADVTGISSGSRVEAPPDTGAGGGGRRLGADEAVAAGVADLGSPVLGQFVVDLDGAEIERLRPADPDRCPAGARCPYPPLDTAEQVTDGDRIGLKPNVAVRFSKLGLLPRMMHTVGSPAVAYLLLVAGVSLLVFELFTGGVGVAGVTGALSFLLAASGLGVVPIRPWALALLAVGTFGFAVDIQTGVPRVWTAVGVAAWVGGSLALFDGVALGWLPLVAGLGGLVLMMVTATPAVARSRYSTPTVGREWMVGQVVEAAGAIDPEGAVRLQGALWRARTNRATPIAAGDEVRVTGLAGVVLEVEPLEGAARDYRDRR